MISVVRCLIIHIATAEIMRQHNQPVIGAGKVMNLVHRLLLKATKLMPTISRLGAVVAVQ